MPMDEIQFEVEADFEAAIDHLKTELRGVRTGRASPGLIEFIKVEAYGSWTELKNIAQVSAPEATQLVVKPFDTGVAGAIVQAIEAADLGLTPQSEGGKLIRVRVPPLSGDRRQKLAAQVKRMGEDIKVRLRNTRRDARDKLKKEQKEGLLTEDTAEKGLEQLDDMTKKVETQVDELIAKKQAELQEV